MSSKCLMEYFSDYVVFDLETTGISCNYDEVIEISALKVKDGKITEEFSELVNPGKPIPVAASMVNNITNAMVKDKPGFDIVLSNFLEFAGENILVGHNIHSFDMKFIKRDAERFLNVQIENDYVDTLKLARTCLPELRHHRLSDLADYYGISTEGAHRALADCKMNQIVYENLAKKLMDVKESKDARLCPKCGALLKKRNGKFGEFLGCTSFPGCRYTENI